MKYVAEYEDISLSDDSKIRYAMNKSIDLIYELVEKEMKLRGETYTHDKFFKEIPTNKLVRDHIAQKHNGQ